MNKTLLFLPFLGAFLGYVLSRFLGITDSLAILGLGILGMFAAGITGILYSRRSRQ
jgi:hypothetical protein